MKNTVKRIMVLVIIFALMCSGCSKKPALHIADRTEGQKLIRSCTDYYAGINEKSLQFFLQKKDGTIDEYIDYSASQVVEFSDDVQQYIRAFWGNLDKQMKARGLKLPDFDEITLVATTGEEVLGAGGYTHGTTIYLSSPMLDRMLEKDKTNLIDMFLYHELFHCLTRSNRQFRADMYSIINFTLNDKEFDIPAELYSEMILNPDVEHHDAYAQFTINGEKKDCYLLFMTDSVFNEPGDSFFSEMYSAVVPVDGSGSYRMDEVPDFWEVVGKNTDYVEDPEECMATNFSYALTFGMDGPEGDGYASPEIIEAILDYLSNKS